VRFANGRLQRPDAMRFTVYRNKDRANPRKKHRRIVVSETERLSYVGNNFSNRVTKSMCRYFVGVLDKDSGQMEVYNAEIFNMQPLLSVFQNHFTLDCNPSHFPPLADWCLSCGWVVPGDMFEAFLENECGGSDGQPSFPLGCKVCPVQRRVLICTSPTQVDLCIEAFGTSKQKRALSSRRMNAVGSDILSTAVTQAATLIQDVAQDDAQNISVFLPPCNEDADKPEDVYKFEDILSPAECEALRAPAAAFVNATPEEVAKRREEGSHCSFVLEELKCLPADKKSRDHKAQCLWFLDTLVKFSYLKVIKKKHPMGPDCPQVVSRKLMKNFTSLTYNNGSVQNVVSASMKTKIAAYVVALALHISGFQVDLTVLQNDLKLQESRMMDIARAMRLKISKAKGLPGLESDQNHKLGTLSLPLPAQKVSGNQRKRKRMN
ncbi:RPA49 polymerase, partial [Heliornis fulica]|nr:RPA49 polymerase [Heliornis fulica]